MSLDAPDSTTATTTPSSSNVSVLVPVFSMRTPSPGWTKMVAGSNAESPTTRDGGRSRGEAGTVKGSKTLVR